MNYILWLLKLRKRYTVTGHSMWPVLRDGQQVFGKKPKSVSSGDIVVARHPFNQSYIIKQIETISDTHVRLISLDQFAEDSRVYGELPRNTIIAKVCI